MLALTKNDVQNGDTVKLNDTGIMYYVKDETKLGTAAAFEVYAAGSAAEAAHASKADNATNTESAVKATKADSASKADAVEWNAVNNKPSKYPSDDTAIAADTITAIINGTYTA